MLVGGVDLLHDPVETSRHRFDDLECHENVEVVVGPCLEDRLDAVAKKACLADAVGADQGGRRYIGLGKGAGVLDRHRRCRRLGRVLLRRQCVERGFDVGADAVEEDVRGLCPEVGDELDDDPLDIVGDDIDPLGELLADGSHPRRNGGLVLRHPSNRTEGDSAGRRETRAGGCNAGGPTTRQLKGRNADGRRI